MSAHRTTKARRPQLHVAPRPLLETLENRRLLSGDVAAVPLGTVLDIQGDLYGNSIKVWSGSQPHQVIVQGEDYTRVNGSYGPVVFCGIEQIDARMDAGCDSFKALGLCLTSNSDARLSVDGGAGDDLIRLCNTTVRSESIDGGGATTAVGLTGEDSSATGPSTGNDCIEVLDSTIAAVGGDSAGTIFTIFGENNTGGTVTCGNDHITVSNTCVTATATAATGNTQLIVQIYGDFNGAGTIGQGNDCISVCNTTFSASAAACATDNINIVQVQIFGDENAVGTIGGGNDSISVADSTVSGTGGLANLVELDVFGDGDAGSIGPAGGNDNISITDTDILTSGSISDEALLRILGDEQSLLVALPGQRDDCITMCDVDLEGAPVRQVQFDTGPGNDHAQVTHSSFGGGFFSMGDGNDVLTFAYNTFDVATLDGGPGYDILYIHDNTGTVIINDPILLPTFEEIHSS